MFTECGFEQGAKTSFDSAYIINWLEAHPDKYGEYDECYETEPAPCYDMKITIGDTQTQIIYNSDGNQIYMADISVYKARLLYSGYEHFFQYLEKKYPYTGKELFLAE